MKKRRHNKKTITKYKTKSMKLYNYKHVLPYLYLRWRGGGLPYLYLRWRGGGVTIIVSEMEGGGITILLSEMEGGRGCDHKRVKRFVRLM